MFEGVEGLLHDVTRPPGRAKVPDAKVREVVALTQSPPEGETTHWALRAMAARVGLTFSTVRTIWQQHGLVPHRAEHNHHEAKPFKWTADPDKIITACKRGFLVMNSYHWQKVQSCTSDDTKLFMEAALWIAVLTHRRRRRAICHSQ